MNLFEWIRKDPERLADAIYWTPYARQVFDRAWETRHTERDPFQRAVNFYTLHMMGIRFPNKRRQSWMEKRRPGAGGGLCGRLLVQDT